MPYKAHRHGDSRVCGASTVVTNQSTVYVNNKLWAVEGDPNSHGAGALIPTAGEKNIIIEGKTVIVHGPDNASPDSLCIPIGDPHCNPATAQGSDDTFCYL